MLGKLRSLFGGGVAPRPSTRQHLSAPSWPAVVYAIGDVHGCHAELVALERLIVADAASVAGEKWLVYLGDYVDRGPDSAGVLDHLSAAPPAGFRRICLAGNHETMMLAFLDNPTDGGNWLEFGGVDTLASYGIDTAAFIASPPRRRKVVLESHLPTEHRTFLAGLPVTLSVPGVIFVHAGLRPGIPLERQTEDDLLWIRDEFFDAAPQGDRLVVHGHTPAAEAVVLAHRICVDTGAFATGRLTSVRLTLNGEPRIVAYSRT